MKVVLSRQRDCFGAGGLVGLVVVGKDARIERPTDSITRAWTRIRQFLFFIKIT